MLSKYYRYIMFEGQITLAALFKVFDCMRGDLLLIYMTIRARVWKAAGTNVPKKYIAKWHCAHLTTEEW